MKNKWILSALAVIGLGVSAQAATVTWNFLENGTGNLGNSSSFTESGITVTAYGYNKSGNTATALYAKNSGVGETGLGIASDGSEHEITTSTYVQLDLSQLLGTSLNTLFFGSVQSGETALIYESSSLGSLGSLIGSVTSDTTFDITSWVQAGDYIGVTAQGTQGYNDPNVLIGSLTATTSVPDGGTTVALLGGALLGLGLLKKKLA